MQVLAPEGAESPQGGGKIRDMTWDSRAWTLHTALGDLPGLPWIPSESTYAESRQTLFVGVEPGTTWKQLFSLTLANSIPFPCPYSLPGPTGGRAAAREEAYTFWTSTLFQRAHHLLASWP